MPNKLETKISDIDARVKELSKEVFFIKYGSEEFRTATAELFDLQRQQFERGVGASVEDFKQQMKMMAESMQMQIERSERLWMSQEAFNNEMVSRVNRLRLGLTVE